MTERKEIIVFFFSIIFLASIKHATDTQIATELIECAPYMYKILANTKLWKSLPKFLMQLDL